VDEQAKAAIETELSNIEESAKWSSQGQFEQAKLWRATHLVVGVPAATLAAVAGATALASTASRVAAGIVALVAAGLSAVAASLDAAGRAEGAQTAGNRYLAVQTAARVARDIDLPRQDLDTARKTVGELLARHDEINAEAAVISKYAYRRAGRNIVAGGQTYATEKRG
jgi:hypothetical protein